MTTFQVIIDSILRIISGVIPVSYPWANQIAEHYLNYTTKVEMDYLISLILCIVFFIYFRFDWLGLFSALVKTITQPNSIKKDLRTLDQEVILFLGSITIPVFLIRKTLTPVIASIEALQTPVAYGICFTVGAFLLRFAYRWNKRIKGLNHLRTLDTIPVILVSILSIHPAFTLPLVFWVGLSLVNYHYEAVFKYSMLLLGVESLIHLVEVMGTTNFGDSFIAVGRLNAIAAMVVVFSVAWWMILENLQKNLSENTFRSYQWFHVFAAIGSFAFFFLKG